MAQMGARVLWEHEVAGSIPVTPTADEWNGIPFKSHKLEIPGSTPVIRHCGIDIE